MSSPALQFTGTDVILRAWRKASESPVERERVRELTTAVINESREEGTHA